MEVIKDELAELQVRASHQKPSTSNKLCPSYLQGHIQPDQRFVVSSRIALIENGTVFDPVLNISCSSSMYRLDVLGTRKTAKFDVTLKDAQPELLIA